jgi:hypothetical protein
MYYKYLTQAIDNSLDTAIKTMETLLTVGLDETGGKGMGMLLLNSEL